MNLPTKEDMIWSIERLEMAQLDIPEFSAMVRAIARGDLVVCAPIHIFNGNDDGQVTVYRPATSIPEPRP